MISGLDAVALAIFSYESGKLNPSTPAVQRCNPGNIESTGTLTTFPDFISGYSALLRDLSAKFTGHNSHDLGPSSTLLALMSVYAPKPENDPIAYAGFVADFVSKALGRVISPDSLLGEIWTSPLTGT